MDFQFDNTRPIYVQLIEQIELAISTGKFTPGERLPSVREMAAEWSVNPNTMQRALAELEQTGLLQAVSTSGRFVTEDASLIAKTKSSLATGFTVTYKEKMHDLNYSDSEIIQFLHAAPSATHNQE